jgi:hypothetical protein
MLMIPEAVASSGSGRCLTWVIYLADGRAQEQSQNLDRECAMDKAKCWKKGD